MSMKRTLLGIATSIVAVLALVTTTAAWAESLPQPQGKPLLQVSGQIKSKNAGEGAVFDLAMLEGLGRTKLVTSTAWTEGRPEFEGVLLSKLMERLGASGATMVAIALNDYKVEIPTADFAKYPVILAYRMDGELLRIRDKGPLWIIYPQDDHPELKNKQTQAKWVWQVKEVQFK
ncbi:molybdopterin-dependent oxidoreductase [Thalassobaculum sp.]|uniref:molybdopterin-dependent oxidoreductase n=1 Tax=Thalassobaculum sp. TaxID=2022740 RepID=UPI0032EAA2A5